MHYTSDRVVFDTAWQRNPIKMEAAENQIIYSKNADWTYEQELRMGANLSTLRRKKFPDGSLGYFLPLPPAALVSVTLPLHRPD